MTKSKLSTPKIQHRAGELRHNQTPAEAKLWSRLRAHQLNGVQFRRQHAIGNYIVDFCAPGQKLIIEVDGGQHLEQEEYDNERIAFFESKGYRVLRFWNKDVLREIESVLGAIVEAVEGNGMRQHE
jgi:very-short-patch-repair endonuclease